jgi:hypothetical protein
MTPPRNGRAWTQKEAIAAVILYSEERGTGKGWVPIAKEYEEWSIGKDVPSRRDINRLFGDWKTVCKRAQCRVGGGAFSTTSYREVVGSLQRAAEYFGDKPVFLPDYEKWAAKNNEASWPIIRRYFTWVEACRVGGLVHGRHQKLEGREDEVITAIKRTCGKERLTVREFNRERAPGVPRAERIAILFGGWSSSLSAAGI